jgi:fidgetin-like protein 1
MDQKIPVNLEDIAGLEYAKKTIEDIVVWSTLPPRLFLGLPGQSRGILLFGPLVPPCMS